MRTYRELDDALGLTDMAGDALVDPRIGRNGQHGLTGLFRQSVFGRLGGYEDGNDADAWGVTALLIFQENTEPLLKMCVKHVH